MPRYRTTTDGTATIVGKLLLLIANGKETSASLAEKLSVSPRQVNRYVLQLIDAGWRIERIGEWLKGDYHLELIEPRIVSRRATKTRVKKAARRPGKK